MSEKIILINPAYKQRLDPETRRETLPPMGILSIGTVLKENGYEVRIIDAGYDDYLEPVKEDLKNERVLFIGLSVMTSQIPQAMEAARVIRQLDPNVTIVWGGIHPTLFPEQTCEHDLVDIAVVREGEYTCTELAHALSKGHALDSIDGIAFKRKGQIIKTPERALLDIRQLPFYNFELIEVEKYIHRDYTEYNGAELEGGSIRRTLPVITGLGCPYRCNFCINVILKKKYRMRSALSIVNEIERLIKKYRVNDIRLHDEDFFVSKKRLFEFLDLIEEKGLKFSWYTNIRANYFHDNYLNLKVLKRIRKNGGFYLAIGAESGSERILKKLCKGITPQMSEKAAQSTYQADITVGWGIITCLPYETEEEMQITYEFSNRLLMLNPKSFLIGPQPFRPYPGSQIYQDIIKEYDWDTPDSLAAWSEQYQDENGYFALDKMPWIKDPWRKKMDLFYLELTQYRNDKKISRKPIVKYIIMGLQSIGKFRFKTKIFVFPFEYYLYQLYLVYKNRK